MTEREGGGKRERKRDPLSSASFAFCLQQLGLGQIKPRLRLHLSLPGEQQGLGL